MSETPQKPTGESILDAYKVPDEPIVVMLPDGGSMTFRPLPTSRHRRVIRHEVDDLVDKIPGIEDKGHRDHFLRRLPELDTSDLRFSAEIHLRSIEPKVSFETACAWHQAPALVQHVQDRLDVADREMLAMLYTNLAEIAEGKTPIPGSDEGSSPASAPSQDEPPTL